MALRCSFIGGRSAHSILDDPAFNSSGDDEDSNDGNDDDDRRGEQRDMADDRGYGLQVASEDDFDS